MFFKSAISRKKTKILSQLDRNFHGKVFRKKKQKLGKFPRASPSGHVRWKAKKSFFSILVLKSVLDGSAPSSQSKFSGTKRAKNEPESTTEAKKWIWNSLI